MAAPHRKGNAEEMFKAVDVDERGYIAKEASRLFLIPAGFPRFFESILLRLCPLCCSRL